MAFYDAGGGIGGWSRMRFIAGLAFLLGAMCPLYADAQTERWASTPAELSAAISASDPGDTVVMTDGVWTDVVISFYADGAAGDTITLRAETPGKVLLNGYSRLKIGGSYLKVDGLHFDGGALASGHVIEFRRSSSNLAHHSRLTNCAITGYNPPSYLTQYKWVSIYGTHNRVDHCHFSGKNHDGTTVVVWLRDPPNDSPGWHRIDHNYFGHRPELGKNGGETLRIGTSSRSMQDAHVTVERNLFEECDGEIEIISNKTGSNIFRHNTFRRSSGVLTLRHGNDAQVYGNFFFGEGKSGSGGVRIIGERHHVYNNYFQDLEGTGYRATVSLVNGVPNSPLNRYFQVKRPIVAFNTFINVREALVMGAGKSSEQSLPPDSVQVVGNLVYTGSGPIVEYEDTPFQIHYESNIFHGAAVGLTDTTGISTVDPDLEVRDGLWRPAIGSPATDAAAVMAMVTHDVDGQVRDSSYDIGADEWSIEPIMYRALTRTEVGPSYQDQILSSVDAAPPVPAAALHAYPNPAVRTVTLDFMLETDAVVHLVVYDILGREVARVLEGRRYGSGAHAVLLDASRWAPGAYVAMLDTAGRRRTAMLIKL